MNESVRTVPRKFIKFLLLGNKSNSVGAVDEKMQTTEVQRDTGISEKVAIFPRLIHHLRGRRLSCNPQVCWQEEVLNSVILNHRRIWQLQE